MNDKDRCETGSETIEDDGYEVARIEKTKRSCHLCEDYAGRRKERPVV